MLQAVYKNRCPRCLGDITSLRLIKGEFCDKCMSEIVDVDDCEKMKHFEKFCLCLKRVKDFENFFSSKIGYKLNALQKSWTVRFFLGESFILNAPTGIGKTTFGLLSAAFVKNSYILFPTKLLVNEAVEQFNKWGIDVVAYRGKKEEKERIKKFKNGILITTTQFLYKNPDIFNDKRFSFVFIDDVDSVVKSAKRIDDILKLVGFDKEDIQKAYGHLRQKEYDEIAKIAQKKRGILILSSATAYPKTKRALLFKYLLGVEIGKPSLKLRGVEDLYDEECSWKRSLEWIERMGRGGLIYLPSDKTKKELQEYVEFLNKHGVKAYSYEEFALKKEEFKKGECFFVGFASYKNPLARGLDLPGVVRYTLFVGVPKIVFDLNENNFRVLYYLFLTIYPYLVRKNTADTEEILKVRNYLKFMKKELFAKTIDEKSSRKLEEICQFLKGIIKKYEREIKNSPEIAFDGKKIITADITGYIQASGRASRFYKGKLTRGISLVLVDSQKAFYSLRKKLKAVSQKDFKNVKEVDLEELLDEISKQNSANFTLKTRFVIVESPTKAKTIASFYGNPLRRIIDGVIVYEIITQEGLLVISASVGHDFDLCDERGVWGVVDKYIPVFDVLENKEHILTAQQICSFEVGEVCVATDPDREGEKIAFDLILNNKKYNRNVKRIEFHEITQTAFEKALTTPRNSDNNLVGAQFYRRIADRWVGYKISSYIQKIFQNPHLSAGRVQTPVLRWIVENTLKSKEKVWIVRILIDEMRVDFDFDEKNEALEFYDSLNNEIKIKKLEKREDSLIQKPFTTSEMLKEASVKLGFSPQVTMNLAQGLFESGLITYHRTDSHRVSDYGKSIAKAYIKENFGEEFVALRSFESKGAHEAIRPTTSQDAQEIIFYNEIDDKSLRLYDLIFRRFIASQMREVRVLKEKFKIVSQDVEIITKIIEDGFNLIYPLKTYDLEEGVKKIKKEIFTRPKYPPYSYGQIIDLMKKRGIGRPSTYAITVEKLLQRKYIVEKNGLLFATKLGENVINTLDKSEFYEFVTEEFSATLESIIDKIEEGEKDYKKEIIALYSLLFGKD